MLKLTHITKMESLLNSIKEKGWKNDQVLTVGELIEVLQLSIPSKTKKHTTKDDSLYDETADTCVVKLSSGPNSGKRCTGKKSYTNPDGSLVCSKHKKQDAVKLESSTTTAKTGNKGASKQQTEEPKVSQDVVDKMLEEIIIGKIDGLSIEKE
jgi:hypothetical protein